MDALEIYYNEVIGQLDINVKIIRYDRGDEYYGIYDETGQHPGPFAKLVQKCAFVCNTQFSVHHNKTMYQKGIIELQWIWLGVC